MINPDIDLTDAEQMLFAQISFEPKSIDGPDAVRKNGDAVCALMHSLTRRAGIPQHRLQWFTDPDYNPAGRGKSRKQVFENNGTRGDAIYRHPHFLPYLPYFIFGSKLLQEAADAFRHAVAECGAITSGDILPLSRLARDLARAHRLGADAAEEFFKLALECRLDVSDACMIRDAVRRIR